jgi:hypothetical protein
MLHIVLFSRPGAAVASRGRARQRAAEIVFILAMCKVVENDLEWYRVSRY